MQLNNFNSYFEIMAGLNLAYATSDWFKSAIDNKFKKIDEIKKKTAEDVEKIRNRTTVIEESHPSNPVIRECLKTLNEQIANADTIKKSEEEFEKVKKSYRSIFLITALYCFSVLLLGGFEQFLNFPNQLKEVLSLNYTLSSQHILSNTFLFAFNFAAVFYLFCLFIFSFIRNHFFDYEQAKNKLFTLSYWLICISVTLILVKYFGFELFLLKEALKENHSSIYFFISSKTNICISLMIAILPYVFHFLRIYIHDVVYYCRLIKFRTDSEKMIKEFDAAVEQYVVRNETLPLPEIVKKPEKWNNGLKNSKLWVSENMPILLKALNRDSSIGKEVNLEDK